MDNRPCALRSPGRSKVAVDVRNGRIQTVYAILNPDKLRLVGV
jgi:hypothetical protein